VEVASGTVPGVEPQGGQVPQGLGQCLLAEELTRKCGYRGQQIDGISSQSKLNTSPGLGGDVRARQGRDAQGRLAIQQHEEDRESVGQSPVGVGPGERRSDQCSAFVVRDELPGVAPRGHRDRHRAGVPVAHRPHQEPPQRGTVAPMTPDPQIESVLMLVLEGQAVPPQVVEIGNDDRQVADVPRRDRSPRELGAALQRGQQGPSHVGPQQETVLSVGVVSNTSLGPGSDAVASGVMWIEQSSGFEQGARLLRGVPGRDGEQVEVSVRGWLVTLRQVVQQSRGGPVTNPLQEDRGRRRLEQGVNERDPVRRDGPTGTSQQHSQPLPSQTGPAQDREELPARGAKLLRSRQSITDSVVTAA